MRNVILAGCLLLSGSMALAGPIECFKIAYADVKFNLNAEEAATLCSGAESNAPVECYRKAGKFQDRCRVRVD